MKKIFIIIFLSLFLFSCGKTEDQILFENNFKCADIAIKYGNFIEKKYNYKLENYEMFYELREYFYSSKKNTCIGIFFKRIKENKNTENKMEFIDLLENKQIIEIKATESINYLISDYK